MQATAGTVERPELGVLAPEPWGWRMKRAREQHAGLVLRQVVDVLAVCMPMSDATISRLESLPEAPTNGRQAVQRVVPTPRVYDLGTHEQIALTVTWEWA